MEIHYRFLNFKASFNPQQKAAPCSNSERERRREGGRKGGREEEREGGREGERERRKERERERERTQRPVACRNMERG